MSSKSEVAKTVESAIGLIPDFPEEGVLFRDITPLIANGPIFAELTTYLAQKYAGHIDYVAGLESRGFILAAPLAGRVTVGFLRM